MNGDSGFGKLYVNTLNVSLAFAASCALGGRRNPKGVMRRKISARCRDFDQSGPSFAHRR
jgi:hypothetical protein